MATKFDSGYVSKYPVDLWMWTARADNIPVAHRLTALSGLSPTGSIGATTINDFWCSENTLGFSVTLPIKLVRYE